jgi:hypothetical protein
MQMEPPSLFKSLHFQLPDSAAQRETEPVLQMKISEAESEKFLALRSISCKLPWG